MVAKEDLKNSSNDTNVSGDQARRKIGKQACVTGKAKIGAGQADTQQPVVEFGRPLQAKEVADIERVVE